MAKKYIKRLIPAAIMLLGLAGCTTVNETKVETHVQEATSAGERGDWHEARRIYSLSFNDPEFRQTSPRFRAVLHYEYGRSLGVTCFFNEAERELTTAYELDKNMGGQRHTGGMYYLSLRELARLNLAQRKYAEAVSYLTQALTELDAEINAEKAPDFYPDLFDDYASALSGAGRPMDAGEAAKRAEEIRNTMPAGAQARAERTPYATRCAKS